MEITSTSPGTAITKEEYMANNAANNADSNVTETSAPVDTVTIASTLQALTQSQEELSNAVNRLSAAGMTSTGISNIIQTASIEASKTFNIEVQQLYNDYVTGEINGNEFGDGLYGAATRMVDSIGSALKDVLAKKEAKEAFRTEAVKKIADTTKSTDAAGTETMVTDADAAVEANVEESTEATKEASASLAIKAEEGEEGNEEAEIVINSGDGILGSGPGSLNENTDNAFGQLSNFFSGIDKMINGFMDNAEDKGDSLLNFAASLNDIVSVKNKAFGNNEDDNVGHKLGMAQNKVTSQLFDSGHGSGGINRIGDAGEGTGNFNATSFMSSISSGINDALKSYKDVMEAEKEAKEEAQEASTEEAVGT